MATKTKETCIYTDSRLVEYEGTNQFKLGTSMCSGCGTRVNSVSGEPVEGAVCPVNARTQPGINAETSQEMIAQVQAASDAKVAEAVEQRENELKSQYEVEMATAQNLVNTARAEAEEAMAELKTQHAKEIKTLNEEHEAVLEEIAKKHDAELKKATAAKPQQ